jgi:hypothetical protein
VTVGHSEGMRLRLRSMLVLTWLLFAGLATAAGFAAVGLVGQGLTVAAAPENGPSVTATATRTTTTTGKPTAKPAAAKPKKTTPKPTTATPRTRKPSTAEPVKRTASRSVRGNYVSATCRGDSVTLSASPAPGWRLDDYKPGPAQKTLAKFHSDHDEVKVEVTCSGGRPVFKVED